MKRHLIAIIVILLMLSIMVIRYFYEKSADAEQKNYSISMADSGFESLRLNNAIVGLVAENVFGYQWHEVTGSTPITHSAMMKGEIDIMVEMWSDNLATYEDDIAKKRIVELGVNYDDNQQGFYVPRYVIEGDPGRGIEPMAPNLKTVQDLKDYAHIFVDDEDPSMGRLYGGVPGWEVSTVMEKKYLAYGLDEMYNFVSPGTEPAMVAEMIAAYEKGKAIVNYYWEPNWILGKYDFILLEDAPYEPVAYKKGHTACPSNSITIISTPKFQEEHPEFCKFLSNFHTSTTLLSSALSYMEETNAGYEETARYVIAQNSELVASWMTDEQRILFEEGLKNKTVKKINPLTDFPFVITIDTDAIDQVVLNFSVRYQKVFSVIKSGLTNFVVAIRLTLDMIPWWVLMILVSIMGYKASGEIKKALLYCILLFFIGTMGLWDLMNETLSIVLASVLIALLIGLPIGVFISTSKRANAIVRPILDTMQTMPVFVYLIPAVIFFGMGSASAIIATVIYAVVPVIRLTGLGILQVDCEVVEAAKAFGSTKLQTLLKVQIPQAMPTIMAGVNQTMMMAMAMVVTCSMIGARGLGDEVLTAVNRIEISKGLISGTAVVVLAILLDRLTQGWFNQNKKKNQINPWLILNKIIERDEKNDVIDVQPK